MSSVKLTMAMALGFATTRGREREARRVKASGREQQERGPLVRMLAQPAQLSPTYDHHMVAAAWQVGH